MTTSADGRVAAPAVRPVRQGIAPRTATVGLWTADSALRTGMAELAAQGIPVLCYGRYYEFMDAPRAVREVAATECPGCALFAACDAEAEREGVWAGRDRTPGKHLRDETPEDLL